MWNLAFSLFTKLGGIKAVGFALACLVPLVLLQCSRSSLEDLREDYRALEARYADSEASLKICREAAGLHDSVLTSRERETIEITNKYNRLREELMRGLLAAPAEDINHEAPNKVSLKDWCAQPVPDGLNSLLHGAAIGYGLPEAAGAPAAGNPGAAAGQAGSEP